MNTRLLPTGQVALPKEIRDRLGLSSGAEMEVEVRDGAVLLRPIRSSTVDDLIGLLPWSGPAKTIEEMDATVAYALRHPATD